MPTPKGSKLSPEHRRKISESLKKSVKHHEALRRRKCHSHPRYLPGQNVETDDSLRVKAMEKKLGVHCILITAVLMKRMVTESPTIKFSVTVAPGFLKSVTLWFLKAISVMGSGSVKENIITPIAGRACSLTDNLGPLITLVEIVLGEAVVLLLILKLLFL